MQAQMKESDMLQHTRRQRSDIIQQRIQQPRMRGNLMAPPKSISGQTENKYSSAAQAKIVQLRRHEEQLCRKEVINMQTAIKQKAAAVTNQKNKTDSMTSELVKMKTILRGTSQSLKVMKKQILMLEREKKKILHAAHQNKLRAQNLHLTQDAMSNFILQVKEKESTLHKLCQELSEINKIKSNELEEIRKKKNSLKIQIQNSQDDRATLHVNFEARNKQNEKLREQLIDVIDQINIVKVAHSDLTSLFEESNQSNEELTDSNNSLKKSITSEKDEIAILCNHIKSIQMHKCSLDEFESGIATTKKKLVEKKSAIDSLKNEIESSKTHLQKLVTNGEELLVSQSNGIKIRQDVEAELEECVHREEELKEELKQIQLVHATEAEEAKHIDDSRVSDDQINALLNEKNDKENEFEEILAYCKKGKEDDHEIEIKLSDENYALDELKDYIKEQKNIAICLKSEMQRAKKLKKNFTPTSNDIYVTHAEVLERETILKELTEELEQIEKEPIFVETEAKRRIKELENKFNELKFAEKEDIVKREWLLAEKEKKVSSEVEAIKKSQKELLQFQQHLDGLTLEHKEKVKALEEQIANFKKNTKRKPKRVSSDKTKRITSSKVVPDIVLKSSTKEKVEDENSSSSSDHENEKSIIRKKRRVATQRDYTSEIKQLPVSKPVRKQHIRSNTHQHQSSKIKKKSKASVLDKETNPFSFKAEPVIVEKKIKKKNNFVKYVPSKVDESVHEPSSSFLDIRSKRKSACHSKTVTAPASFDFIVSSDDEVHVSSAKVRKTIPKTISKQRRSKSIKTPVATIKKPEKSFFARQKKRSHGSKTSEVRSGNIDMFADDPFSFR